MIQILTADRATDTRALCSIQPANLLATVSNPVHHRGHLVSTLDVSISEGFNGVKLHTGLETRFPFGFITLLCLIVNQS